MQKLFPAIRYSRPAPTCPASRTARLPSVAARRGLVQSGRRAGLPLLSGLGLLDPDAAFLPLTYLIPGMYRLSADKIAVRASGVLSLPAFLLFMDSRQVLRGVLMVGLGAASYGMLATFVKLAYSDTGITGTAFTPAEVIGAQFLIGILTVALLCRYSGRTLPAPDSRQRWQLMLAGTSTGLTSIFYYMAVVYIDVSIGIVLLMQTVWMGVFLEALLDRKQPSLRKILAVIIVLAGTALAAKLTDAKDFPDWRGIALGLLAAASFTTTMYTANKIAVGIVSTVRSLYMLYGGGIVVLLFVLTSQQQPVNFDILWKWGLLLALFGTVIPPLLLNAGFPKTGIGLGSIVSSLELPVSVTMAYVLLNEEVSALQWLGIALILLAIVLMNLPARK